MECNSLIKNMDLPEAFSCTKYQWKKLVVKKINEKNRNDVLNSIEKSKKLNFEELKAEEFERKPYISTLNIHDARTKFALRSKMTKTIKLNFKNDPKYKKELWQCNDCTKIDSQEHILWCQAYAALRVDKNLDEDKDLTRYFQQVLRYRED